MLYKFAVVVALTASAVVAQNNNQKGGQNNQNGGNNQNGQNQNQNGGNNNNGGGGGGDANGLTLLANAIQKGSAQDGSENISDGQALSTTSDNNFINFCSGKTLTDGLQVQGGSCNGIGAYITPKNTAPKFLTRGSHGRYPIQAKHGLLHNHVPNTGR